MTNPVCNPHNFTTQHPTQQTEGGGAQNPLLLSLPYELLVAITERVATATTPQQAAKNAITWGRVSVLPHQMTHESCIASVISHGKRQKDLDEALMTLWDHIVPKLRAIQGAVVPPMTTAPEVRAWMIDLNNRRFLDTIPSVNLTRRGLKVIPPEINMLCNLRNLFLNDNLITQIGPRAFDCPALWVLHLHNNRITQIGPRAFDCPALEHLNLYSNQIITISPETFAGCPAVVHPNLSGNDLLLCASASSSDYFATFNAFSRYVCRSEFAVVYKAISEGRLTRPEIVERLKQLEDRNLIYERVYWEAVAAAGREERVFSTDGDHQWGEHHVCDDMPTFCRALKSAVCEKYKRLSPEQKGVVHDRIYAIAQEDGVDSDAFIIWSAPNFWGARHREENVLRFIDAMAEVRTP